MPHYLSKKNATLGHRLTQHYIDKTYYLLGCCNCDLRKSFCLFTTSIAFVCYFMILSILWLFRMKPRLADPSFRPQRIDILATMDNFLNLLRIRYSSPLFRLRTANAIEVRYFKFHHYIKLLHQLVHDTEVLNHLKKYFLSATNYFQHVNQHEFWSIKFSSVNNYNHHHWQLSLLLIWVIVFQALRPWYFNFRCHLQQRVRFHNTGPSLVSGVIVMSIEDGHDGFPGLSQLDPMYVKTYCNFVFDD